MFIQILDARKYAFGCVCMHTTAKSGTKIIKSVFEDTVHFIPLFDLDNYFFMSQVLYERSIQGTNVDRDTTTYTNTFIASYSKHA